MSSSDLKLQNFRIPLEEIMLATDNFSQKNYIGGGGFGRVYKGEFSESRSNRIAAIKRLDRNSLQGKPEFQTELKMLSGLHHKNIITFIGYCDDDGEMMIVYEYAHNQSLDHHLQNPSKIGCINWVQRLKICIGAAQGLEYLHSGLGDDHRIIHRDMKSSNILLDENLEAKISDFGLSKVGPRNMQQTQLHTRVAGTRYYLDPHYNVTQTLKKESDVYSFGVVLFEILCGRLVYPKDNRSQGLVELVQWHKDVGLDQLIDPHIKDQIEPISLRTYTEIAYKCIKLNYVKRPVMSIVVKKLEEALQSQLVLAMQNQESPSDNFLNDFYIPDYILIPDGKVEAYSDVPACPTIVFINSKSGGQLGGNLIVTYRSVLNKNQVFDLGEETPDNVLRRLYQTLEKLKLNGDTLASQIQERLRIIVAGGDGTAGWLLGVVIDLKLSHPPPIATMPLGTGNNLPFAFGWGKKNPGTDRESVLRFLEQVMKAKEMEIDSWHILMRMKAAPKEGPCDPIAPLDLPHSLHAFNRVSDTDELNMSGCDTFRGGFWNYFSMGMDAQVSYAFHSERKLHPEKFKNQLVNQSTYAKGWAASLFHQSSRNIAQLAKIKVMQRHGEWKDLHISPSIRSIICLNLPSFSGGLNPWGTPSRNKTRDRDLTPPYVDDGLLEIVGFRDAWHGLVLLAPKGHGTRLAQTHRVRFEFHKGAANCTYMRIDGEPWKQPLPVDGDTVVVEISHLGRVKILATDNCRSKSVHNPSTPSGQHGTDDNDSDDEDDSVPGEEWRKFGAADTFKLPDDIDIAHLS